MLFQLVHWLSIIGQCGDSFWGARTSLFSSGIGHHLPSVATTIPPSARDKAGSGVEVDVLANGRFHTIQLRFKLRNAVPLA